MRGGKKRIKEYEGQHALVDGIPFTMPVQAKNSPALMAAFPINAEKAKKFLPSKELHPFRIGKKGFLVITVIDYRDTTIGKYIEFSIGIACTHGKKPAPSLLPGLFMKKYGTGQYIYELPVSTEISVKGGKGIWGMPKQSGRLNFLINDKTVSSQYDDMDGNLMMKIEIDRPKRPWFPINLAAVNYSAYRGMLMKSYIYFKDKMGFSLFSKGDARLYLGNHPRMQALKELEIRPDAALTAFFPDNNGMLDDYLECWFITSDKPVSPKNQMEGMESVVNLGLSQKWPPAPNAKATEDHLVQ